MGHWGCVRIIYMGCVTDGCRRGYIRQEFLYFGQVILPVRPDGMFNFWPQDEHEETSFVAGCSPLGFFFVVNFINSFLRLTSQ